MATENRRCPICGRGRLIRRVKAVLHRYQEYETVVEQPGEFCDLCDEGILSGEDLLATQSQIEAFLASAKAAQAEDFRSELRRIRLKLRLTQAEAARIAGGGVNAFSRYERGQARPGLAVIRLFRLLERHPELLDEVRRGAG